MAIAKVDIFEEAKKLVQPFLVVDLAEIDDYAARLFISQGMVAWHKHVDQEQLFLSIDGELILESEWGNTVLRSGEMSVIPKAVTHRCGSVVRTIALVFERRFFSNRQNGQRRLFVLEGAGEIRTVSIGAEAMLLSEPFVSRRLTAVDDLVLSIMRFQGEGVERSCQDSSELLLVHGDDVLLESDPGTVSLGRGEMTVFPPGAAYSVQAPGGAVVLRAAKDRPQSTKD